MKDIPYRTLKEDERAYQIMLLRDQTGKSFTKLAKAFQLSAARIRAIYDRQKVKQIYLYIRHISVVLGHPDDSKIRSIFWQADECYRNWTCSGAYLEQKYHDILTTYRNGEPGLPQKFIDAIPPLRGKLTKEETARVVEMRETEKAPFAVIAKELNITQSKAKHTYDFYYHAKVLALIQNLIEKAESREEKEQLLKHYSFRLAGVEHVTVSRDDFSRRLCAYFCQATALRQISRFAA